VTKITNDFDLVNYFKQKVINYGIDLLCISSTSNLMKSIASIEQLRMVGVDVHQMMTKEFDINTLTNIGLTAINIAGFDKNTLDFVKQIPERYKNIEVSISDDFDRIINRGTSMIVDRFLGMLDTDSLFGGKSKEMFRIIQRHTPLIKHIYDGNNQAIVTYAFNNIDEVLPKIPVIQMLGIGLSKAVERVVNKEQLNIRDRFTLTINQLNSMKGECTVQTLQLTQTILNSPDKWMIFEQNKHQLNTNICQLLRPVIELERQFRDEYERLTKNPLIISSDGHLFNYLNVTYGTIQSQRNSIKQAIERQHNDNTILQRAMIEFIDELSQNSNNKKKSSEATNALKEYFSESIIRPSIENACEEEMDQNDQQLMDKFTRALAYITEQQKKFNRT
jgi:hypothetical protein